MSMDNVARGLAAAARKSVLGITGSPSALLTSLSGVGPSGAPARQSIDRAIRYGVSHAVWRAMLGAVIDIDFINDKAAWLGRKFDTIAAFLVAIGGTVLSGTGASRVLRIPWTDNSVHVVAEFTNHPDYYTSGAKAALSLWTSETNRAQVGRSVSNGTWTVAGYTNGTIFYLPAGFGPIGGPIVRAAFSMGSTLRGAFNGADAQVATNYPGTAPALAWLTIGGDHTGAVYGAPFRRFALYTDPVTDNAAVKAASLPAYDLVVDGDSYGGGAGNPEVGLGRSLALLGWTPYVSAVGGSPLSSGDKNIKDRVVGLPAALRALPFVACDGDNNNYGSTATDLASWQAIIAALGHTNYLIIPTAKREGQIAGQQAAVLSLTAALLAAFPGKVLPCMPYLLSLGTGTTPDNTAIANGNVPPSALMADGVHLASAAMNGFAALVDNTMRGDGWGMAA